MHQRDKALSVSKLSFWGFSSAITLLQLFHYTENWETSQRQTVCSKKTYLFKKPQAKKQKLAAGLGYLLYLKPAPTLQQLQGSAFKMCPMETPTIQHSGPVCNW